MSKATLIDNLVSFIELDNDFKPYLQAIPTLVNYLEEDLSYYLLDKKYQDISYIVLEGKIINLDEVYSVMKNITEEENEEVKKTHQRIREVLQKYGNPEFGDCIVDEICFIFGYATTTDVESNE